MDDKHQIAVLTPDGKHVVKNEKHDWKLKQT